MSPIKEHGRQYDIILFGATGYTGKLTAEYITTNLPTDLKWAIAGRSESKLQAIIDDCQTINPDRKPPAIEIANLSDEDLKVLARKTCVLLTTVGPYCLYGEYAFKACAESGTHYVDVTGETTWVHKMIKKYEKVAKESGALMFPQSGLESLPPDLCAWKLARTIRTELDAPTKDVKLSIHKLSSAPSGGTLASLLSIFGVFSLHEIRESMKPYAQSPIPHPEIARPKSSILEQITGLRTIPNLGLLTTSVAGTTDGAVVERTWGLLAETPSRTKEFYGPKFTFAEYFKARNWLHGFSLHLILFFGGLLLAFVPPFRSLVKKFVFQPGEGVDKEETKKEEVEFRGIAYPDSTELAGKQAYCRAWFRGGIYYLTGIFLSEIAATLLEDDVGLSGGVFTPACLGQGLIDRLEKGGFHMEAQILDD